jgi:Glutamyl- and glutaminyl-tRNA synthetases
MAVLNPLKVIIDNYPEGQIEFLTLENNPENENLGTREIPFGRELYIERDDFMEEPVKKFFRLAPDKEVRLKGAYFVKCVNFVKDENGNVTEVHCTYDPETKSGSGFEGRKVKGTLHWVNAETAVKAEARLYDSMMLDNPDDPSGDMIMNPNSLEVCECFIEPSIKEAKKGERFQFMRNGYFCVDTKDSKDGAQVFNRIVALKSSFKPAK